MEVDGEYDLEKCLLHSTWTLKSLLGHADCFFQPVLRPGAETGSASLITMRGAAAHLIATCAERWGEGGIITNLGERYLYYVEYALMLARD